MKVKPNLFLNMSPQTTEEGALAFARNMKLDDDGNLISDYGYKNIEAMANYNIVGHIVGLDNKIYFFCATQDIDVWTDEVIVEYDELTETATPINSQWNYSGGEIDGYVSTNQSGEKILTIAEYVEGGSDVPLKHINLSYSNVLDESIYSQAPVCPTANLVLKDTYVKTIPNGVYVFFIRYKIRKDVYTNWFLCSRPIFGGTSESISTLQGGLKFINTHKDSAKSFILQLDFASNANKNSYKEFQLGFIITHDEATDARAWKHFNINEFADTPNSYVTVYDVVTTTTLEEEHIGVDEIYYTVEETNINTIRSSTQVPDSETILDNSDDSSIPSGYIKRIVVHSTPVTINVGNLIYFDYEDVEEANINDLLETTYEIYNVRNVTAFKNKLYISNYIESNFNPNDINDLANHITLTPAYSAGDNIDYRNLKLNNVELYYDITKGYYTRAKNNTALSNIITNKDFFNFNVSKLSKISTKEKEGVVKFSLIWNADLDPDIAIVYNIYNYIHNKKIFGNDYGDPYQFTMINDPLNPSRQVIDEGLGIKLRTADAGLYYYQPPLEDSKLHPWYDLYLTFAFGSFRADEGGTSYAREGCSYFNKRSFGFTWITRDAGFTDAARTAMVNKLKEDIAGKSLWGKLYLEITSGGKVYTIGYDADMDLDNYASDDSNQIEVLSENLLSTETISGDLQDSITSWVYNAVKSSIVGIDENGTPIMNIDEDDIRVNNISVRFKRFEFTLDEESVEDTDVKIYKNFKVNLKTTDYSSLCTFVIKSSLLSITDTEGDIKQASTLMPLSTYQPYVHFVDESNIITNGVKLPQFTTSYVQSDTQIIKLNYSISNLPFSLKYKSCFISLVNVGDIVMEGFGYTKDPNDNSVNILHCLEIDTMLYNINDKITIKGLSGNTIVPITSDAKYNSSGTNYPPLAFGNCGYVSWTGSVPASISRFYIIIERNKSAENIDNLIKSSSYIPLVNTSARELPDGYYGSWRCLVKKPNFDLSSSCYVAGKDVYSVDRSAVLSLTEFKNFIQVQDSVTYFIRSNFNLNYLSLTEDINDSIFSIGNAASGVRQAAKVINSATLSYIYELKFMYKSFSNKYFRRVDTDYKIDFDNTIRVSNVLSDETFNNSIFKFFATDYYNIPTDRGIIVNLFSIGNIIFAHTKSSLYKFDGNQTIVSNDKDISLKESEPFDSGISQVFDSEYGYGGIETKQSGCITFDSYFFYDKISNHIFGYAGNNQMQVIDGNIYKLLTYYKPSDCKTLHDELNCRILFEFTSGRSEHDDAPYRTFTLSYNYKTKSFISIHDLTLLRSFASRHKSYSYNNNLIELFNTDNNIDTTVVYEDMNITKLFGQATVPSLISFGSQINITPASQFSIAVVMFPSNNIRECVDSVKYVSNVIQSYIENQSEEQEDPDNIGFINQFDMIINNQVSRNNPVINFYIISDSCVSSVINTNVNDNARPNTLLDYEGFKYDMGFWTGNYFRNNINAGNIYNYPQKYPTRRLDADNNSLVYGRYFILVFNFKNNLPIKFEEVYINTDKY